MLTDKLYDSFTQKKISMKKLLEYSLQFLLDIESNTSILPFFELDMISKYFPEYKNDLKNLCNKNWEIEKKIATFVMKKKIYYIVVDMKRILLKEIECIEAGFLSVSIV